MTSADAPPQYVVDFSEITSRDVARVGGKNASLGELFRAVRQREWACSMASRPPRMRTGDCLRRTASKKSSGPIPFEVDCVDASQVPDTRTQIMIIAGDPGPALALSAIPNAGVGLARTEFIVTNHIGVHPMALARYPKLKDAQAVRKIRARIGGKTLASSSSAV